MSPQPGIPNPYRPGAAVTPVFLAGREQEVRRFRSSLRAAPGLPLNVRVTGLRGVGKTVLLKRFEEVANESPAWLTSRWQLEPRHNTDADITDLVFTLRQNAERQVSRVARIRKTVHDAVTLTSTMLHVSWEDIELSLGVPHSATRQLSIWKCLFEATDLAVRHGYQGYLLMFDEAQVLHDEKDRNGEHPLSLLVAAVNGLQDKEVPGGLVLCGLPTLRTNLLRARTYSERMFRGEEIGRLGDGQAVQAFVRPLDNTGVTADAQLVEGVVQEVEGYPFFIQLWGAELWDAAQVAGTDLLTTTLLTSVEPDIYRRLDVDFYAGRVESLTPAEQDLLIATAQCPYPPLYTADIHSRARKSEGNINVLMGRLSEQGVVYRIQRGVYEYTAPKFYDYLQRRREGADRAHGLRP